MTSQHTYKTVDLNGTRYVLAIYRTTIYRALKPVKQRQLDLMKFIDRIHMDDLAWGCRRVREYLIELGHPIGRRHCTTPLTCPSKINRRFVDGQTHSNSLSRMLEQRETHPPPNALLI